MEFNFHSLSFCADFLLYINKNIVFSKETNRWSLFYGFSMLFYQFSIINLILYTYLFIYLFVYFEGVYGKLKLALVLMLETLFL